MTKTLIEKWNPLLLSAAFMATTLASACSPQNQGSETATFASPTAYGAYKKFSCTTSGTGGSHLVTGMWKLHESGGQYEVKGLVMRSPASGAVETELAFNRLQWINNSPVVGSNGARLESTNGTWKVEIGINSSTNGAHQISAWVRPNWQKDERASRGICNMESALVAPQRSTPAGGSYYGPAFAQTRSSFFKCMQVGSTTKGGHRYELFLDVHPSKLALKSHVETKIHVIGLNQTYPVGLKYNSQAAAGHRDGRVVIQDGTKRVSVVFVGASNMNANLFKATVVHRLFPGSGGVGTATAVLECGSPYL